MRMKVRNNCLNMERSKRNEGCADREPRAYEKRMRVVVVAAVLALMTAAAGCGSSASGTSDARTAAGLGSAATASTAASVEAAASASMAASETSPTAPVDATDESASDTPAASGSAASDTAAVGGLTISAAASLKDAMAAVEADWETAHPDMPLTLNFGSSGTLQKQIEEGASVDVFISAASKQMDALEKAGLVAAGTRRNLVGNGLVLVVPKGADGPDSFAALAGSDVKQVALGEPGSVPAGQYAEETLTSLGLLDAVKAKAVYGKDVKAVLTWVESGEADAGIVYRTDALASGKVDMVAEASNEGHSPIVYPAAVVTGGKNAEAASSFLDWLYSGDEAAAFTDHGFEWIAR